MIARRLLVVYLTAAMICSVIIVSTTAFIIGPPRSHLQYATSTTAGMRTYLTRKTTTTKIILHESSSSTSSSTSSDAAAALTDFMAKAHEEKIAAMSRVEGKYRGQIAELENRIIELEDLAKQTTPTSGNSYAFPATNKDLTEKVQAYRIFISDYTVKSQEEKQIAIKAAENKMSAKYEAIIDELSVKGNK
mmetsp:Transcript_1768/g.1988  ORF Transcript_1768/g.1988 Transcript_1768/m.1988 type:complete len:191 (-) Transcript_1768:78-650(-)